MRENDEIEMEFAGEYQIHQPHDKGYKYLLSSKKIFMELLRSFVHQSWVNTIDESHLITIDKSYILPDFSEKEADLVYQLKLKERDVIFYVLMELQSSVDFQMPYRLLLYQVEIWRDVLKNTSKEAAGKKAFRLPAIIPIVLYNGESPWTASRRFRETISGQDIFGEELLDFQYILLDVQRYTEEELLGLSNVIGSIFLVDREADWDQLRRRLRQLAGIIRATPQELQQRFITWLSQIIVRRLPPEERQEVEKNIAIIQEKGADNVMSNLEKTLDKIIEQKRIEGLQQGLEKGIEQGLEKGIEQGLEKGIEQGLEKGIEQGLEKGIEQGKIMIAKEMLAAGMDIGLIVRLTKLSMEQIEQLKRESQ